VSPTTPIVAFAPAMIGSQASLDPIAAVVDGGLEQPRATHVLHNLVSLPDQLRVGPLGHIKVHV